MIYTVLIKYQLNAQCSLRTAYQETAVILKGENMIYCYCESCKHHDEDDTCRLNTITISDREMTAAGFLPQCQEYEEED